MNISIYGLLTLFSLVGLLKCLAHNSCLTLSAKMSVIQGGLGRSWELKLYLTLIQNGSFIQNDFSLVPSYSFVYD